MIANCSCGAVYWAEPPSSCCPRCAVPALGHAKLETVEEFEERVVGYTRTTLEIRSLPEAPE